MLTKTTVMDRMDARFIFGGGITSTVMKPFPTMLEKRFLKDCQWGQSVNARIVHIHFITLLATHISLHIIVNF